METVRGPYTVTTAGVPVGVGVPHGGPPVAVPPQVEIEVLPDGRTRVKAGPPPDRKVEGSIHVLGSDDARRKQKEDELLALALGSTRVMAPSAFPPQRPLYTALPGGGMMMMGGPQMPQPQGDMQPNSSEPSQATSQGQQIQSIGAPSAMTSVMPPGMQYLPAGPAGMGLQLAPGGQPIFPPPNVGMEHMGQDPFLHPGQMPPPFGYPRGNSDSEFDSDGESRRHRGGRRESSRHRRHRDRSDRDRERERSSTRDRDRDRSRADHRDRSTSRRRHESRSTSDRKKHVRSSSTRPEEEEGGERKSRRRTKEVKEEPADTPSAENSQEPATIE